jgi:hypothetical protein
MDKIIVMRDGQVSEMGSYQELVDRGGAFADFMAQYLINKGEGSTSPSSAEGSQGIELGSLIATKIIELCATFQMEWFLLSCRIRSIS